MLVQASVLQKRGNCLRQPRQTLKGTNAEHLQAVQCLAAWQSSHECDVNRPGVIVRLASLRQYMYTSCHGVVMLITPDDWMSGIIERSELMKS